MHLAWHTFSGRGALVAGTRPLDTKRARLILATHVHVASGSDTVFTMRMRAIVWWDVPSYPYLLTLQPPSCKISFEHYRRP